MAQLARLHAEAMGAGMALGATRATDLDEFHRRALAEPGRVIVLAERDGAVVGMAHLAPSHAANAPHRAEVQRVAVAEQARGTGVGHALMAAVEQAAVEQGITLLWLTTHDGTDACAFYESVGYTKLGVMPSYSERPDGTRSAGAFYFRELAATVTGVTSDARHQLRLTHQIEHDLGDGLFDSHVLARGDRELRRDGWPTSRRDLPHLGEPIFRNSMEGAESVVVEVGEVLLQINLNSGMVYLQAAAAASAPIESLIERLKRDLPTPDPSSAHEVTVTFWTYGPQGPVPSWRSIAVPSWDEIRDNYAATTRAGLEELMRGFQPAHGGQLLLWHGVAGTGKTFGLRALAWEWRDWCDFHYIVDPDTFFGQHADYLMSVLLQPEYIHGMRVPSMHGMIVSSGPGWSTSRVESSDDDENEAGAKAWRVLVLEDTGELLTPDAKMVIGQGLSRFLNVVDGLIGQGLRVLVLVTTNEPIKKLHPAVARPGRCAANIEFEQLPSDEAAAWLVAHGISNGTARSATLAELYATAEGRDPSEVHLVGFAEDDT